MDINSKIPVPAGEKTLIIAVFIGIFLIGVPIFEFTLQKSGADLIPGRSTDLLNQEELVFFEGNTLYSNSNPSNPEPKVVQKLPVVVTAYSSTPWQTDSNPYITAAGTRVKDGIIANNLLPFGTKVKIPELYGDKVFVVEDRMSWKKGNYHVDIWFPTFWQAKNFGAKRTYIEILEG